MIPAIDPIQHDVSTALRQLEAFLIDLDGVLVRGERCIDGAVAFLELLRSRQRPFRILTNNSTRTPEQYAAALSAAGAVSPNRPASKARARHGKASRSGGSKSSRLNSVQSMAPWG